LLQDLEAKDSDLWGSRGVTLAGMCMLYMALMNFRGTLVRAAAAAKLWAGLRLWCDCGCGCIVLLC
jgi:hypothetical protein